jgi:hypothetical protein
MSRKLISGQKPFKMLIANLRQGSNPSRGVAGNPIHIRDTYTVQHFPEIPGRGPEVGQETRTPGTGTRVGHVTYTVDGVPVRSSGTITIAGTTFAGPTTVNIGGFVLTTDVEFVTTGGAVASATGVLTVVAFPSTATLTIGGVALTDAGAARTPGLDDYNGALGSAALIAADIVAAINDGANGFTAIVTAVDSGGGIITLTAVAAGFAGNSVTLLTSDAGDVTVSGANLAGGTDAGDAAATSLAAAIDVLPGYSAVAVASVITVDGLVGPLGNEAVFTSDGSSPQNFVFDPVDGTLDGAEPRIGPPILA